MHTKKHPAFKEVIRHMIDISEDEYQSFLALTYTQSFKKNEIISRPDTVPNEVYFILKGIIRVLITDHEGQEHTIHFALENQFIADYANFILRQPATYSLMALENTETIVLPRSAIDWGYQHLKEGQKMGRLIAEYYFIYQDDRIKNMYARTPKERYDNISAVFPNIHNRVPQHMIASYLGITPVHLSRLKKER
jgi:CRP-like cAMP-binding protein